MVKTPGGKLVSHKLASAPKCGERLSSWSTTSWTVCALYSFLGLVSSPNLFFSRSKFQSSLWFCSWQKDYIAQETYWLGLYSSELDNNHLILIFCQCLPCQKPSHFITELTCLLISGLSGFDMNLGSTIRRRLPFITGFGLGYDWVINDEWLGHGRAVDIWAVDAELMVPTLQWMIVAWKIGIQLNPFFCNSVYLVPCL